jgi:Domain of unknown function (DUF4397)
MTRRALISPLRRVFLGGGILMSMLMLGGLQALPASAAAMAFVRIVHAAPDAGTVDVFMDGREVLSNFQFGTVTGYTPVTAGAHKLQIAVIGKGLDAAVLSQNLTVNAGIPYTVAALGNKATGFSLRVYADDNQVNANGAKLRVYHLSPGTGQVSVAASGTTLINGLAYPRASVYLTEPAGSYTFAVTADPHTGGTAVPAQLKPWTITSIFALNSPAGPGSGLKLVDSQVNGVPGMPGTGSDPHALPAPAARASTATPWPWLWAALVALLAVSLVAGKRLID